MYWAVLLDPAWRPIGWSLDVRPITALVNQRARDGQSTSADRDIFKVSDVAYVRGVSGATSKPRLVLNQLRR